MDRKPSPANPVTAQPPHKIAPELYLAEIEKAAQRIGATTDQAGAWLARFARTDLESLSTGQWTDLLYEVACLSEYQYQTKTAALLWQHAITLKDWQGNWRYKDEDELVARFVQILDKRGQPIGALDVPPVPPPCELPPRDAVTALQRQVRAALVSLQENHSVSWMLPPIHLTVGAFRETDENVVLGTAESPQVLFTYNLALLLVQNAVRIRRCADCTQRFFADRKNKAYCSPRCQSRAGTRRWRTTPPDRIGKRGRPRKNVRNSSKGSLASGSQGRKGGSRHGKKRR